MRLNGALSSFDKAQDDTQHPAPSAKSPIPSPKSLVSRTTRTTALCGVSPLCSFFLRPWRCFCFPPFSHFSFNLQSTIFNQHFFSRTRRTTNLPDSPNLRHHDNGDNILLPSPPTLWNGIQRKGQNSTLCIRPVDGNFFENGEFCRDFVEFWNVRPAADLSGACPALVRRLSGVT